MTLCEVVLDYEKYKDSDELIHQVFAKKINNRFNPNSEAIVLPLTLEEMEMDLADISNARCPGFVYFLEIFMIEDLYNDFKQFDEHKTDEEMVNRIIYYAEFDA